MAEIERVVNTEDLERLAELERRVAELQVQVAELEDVVDDYRRRAED